VEVTWTRRTRIGGDSWQSMEVPVGEASLLFQIHIEAGDSSLRTATTGATSYLYTAAQQNEDDATGQLMIRVAQVSEEFGAGPYASLAF
jgi:hypothetical protein